jgi:hypothetical protein
MSRVGAPPTSAMPGLVSSVGPLPLRACRAIPKPHPPFFPSAWSRPNQKRAPSAPHHSSLPCEASGVQRTPSTPLTSNKLVLSATATGDPITSPGFGMPPPPCNVLGERPPPTLLLQLTGASPFSLPLRTTGAYPIHRRPPHASTAVKRHRPRPKLSPSCRTASRVNLRPHKFAPDLRSPSSPHLATGVVTGSRTIAASQRAGRHHTGRLIGHGPGCRTHRADGRGLNSAHLARDCFPFLKIQLNT